MCAHPVLSGFWNTLQGALLVVKQIYHVPLKNKYFAYNCFSPYLVLNPNSSTLTSVDFLGTNFSVISAMLVCCQTKGVRQRTAYSWFVCVCQGEGKLDWQTVKSGLYNCRVRFLLCLKEGHDVGHIWSGIWPQTIYKFHSSSDPTPLNYYYRIMRTTYRSSGTSWYRGSFFSLPTQNIVL